MQNGFLETIGNPARQALGHAGYPRLEQLPGLSEREVLKLHGVGPKAVGILRAALAERGLSFKGTGGVG